MRGTKRDWTGKAFGTAVVLREHGSGPKGPIWIVRCGCGTEIERNTSLLHQAESRSGGLFCPVCLRQFQSQRARFRARGGRARFGVAGLGGAQ